MRARTVLFSAGLLVLSAFAPMARAEEGVLHLHGTDGARVRVEFLQRIRHGRRFPNHRALAQQIARDVEAVERMLASRQ